MSAKYEHISSCRICKHDTSGMIIDLGHQSLGSVFPKLDEPSPLRAPLTLVKCDKCHLVQLLHTVEAGSLYTDNYGYRSGLNQTMISHLKTIVEDIEGMVSLQPDDIVLDIGCNDSTLLSHYKYDSKTNKIVRLGIDPSGPQFKQYYPEDITLVPEFFNKQSFEFAVGTGSKAKAVTSISMFYDLPDPMQFVKDVSDILEENEGVWVMEQSYMPTMIERNSFDTICHEHLEYYTLTQIKYMCDRADLKIIKVSFNDCNGGSFRVAIAKNGSKHVPDQEHIDKILKDEEQWSDIRSFDPFVSRCLAQRNSLATVMNVFKSLNKPMAIYGASTKGNTLLQWYNIPKDFVIGIAERNPRKYGCKTPGTEIPIYSEDFIRSLKPDYMLVLPWHFKEEFLKRESEFLDNGGQFIFPLPTVHIERRCKAAIVFGASGQLGQYLTKMLKSKKYIVYEIGRNNMDYTYQNLEDLITSIRPDEIYNLAAETDSRVSFAHPVDTQYINGVVVTYICEILHNIQKHTGVKIKYFQANSVELFKGCKDKIDENRIDFYPTTPYGVGKLQAYWNTRLFREEYNLFACTGICSNIESVLRRPNYVTRKIADYLKANDFSKPLSIGDPTTKIDWIHAHDVAQAIITIMDQPEPADYMIVSGKMQTIKEFTEEIANQLDLKDAMWQDDNFVVSDKIIIEGNTFDTKVKNTNKQNNISYDNTKLKKIGWTPEYDFTKLCKDFLTKI